MASPTAAHCTDKPPQRPALRTHKAPQAQECRAIDTDTSLVRTMAHGLDKNRFFVLDCQS